MMRHRVVAGLEREYNYSNVSSDSRNPCGWWTRMASTHSVKTDRTTPWKIVITMAT